ncbi:MAG: NmrA family NAD(P)-binding protein [Solirubrobacterales bacterium]
MKALIAGATGFVGRSLAPELLEDGLEVRCLVRSRGSDASLELAEAGCELVEGDVTEDGVAERALEGIDVAYFLIHMMGRVDDWADQERFAARRFGEAASAAGVSRVIYLGGLAEDTAPHRDHGEPSLSEHLQSRHDIAIVLERTGPPLTYFRAAMIVGAGSESFELLRSIVERLPALPTPDWLSSRTQPIGIRDTVAYLRQAPEVAESAGREVQIGGPDVLAHLDVVDAMARELGRKPLRRLAKTKMLDVVFDAAATPGAIAAAAGAVTTGNDAVATAITLGLPGDTVVTDRSGMELFAIKPEPLSIALHRAIEEDDEED